MAICNHERVGKALDLRNAGLRPFVERGLQAAYGKDLVARAGLSVSRLELAWREKRRQEEPSGAAAGGKPSGPPSSSPNGRPRAGRRGGDGAPAAAAGVTVRSSWQRRRKRASKPAQQQTPTARAEEPALGGVSPTAPKTEEKPILRCAPWKVTHPGHSEERSPAPSGAGRSDEESAFAAREKKQIPLPRLRDRNDRSGGFHPNGWTEGPCETREAMPFGARSFRPRRLNAASRCHRVRPRLAGAHPRRTSEGVRESGQPHRPKGLRQPGLPRHMALCPYVPVSLHAALACSPQLPERLRPGG